MKINMDYKFKFYIFCVIHLTMFVSKAIDVVDNQPSQELITTTLELPVLKKVFIAQDLKLYQIIMDIHGRINQSLKEFEKNNVHSRKKENFYKALILTKKGLDFIDSIINDFNTDQTFFNSEIKYRFIMLCNLLKNEASDNIKLRHFRQQLLEFEKFNKYTAMYYLSRRDFLKQEDINLFNKIIQFNQLFMLCLLREEFLDVSFGDQVIDFLVYRPWEFMCEHKWLTITVAALVGSVFCYYYIYPRYFMSTNSSPYHISSLVGLMQEEAQCGFYASLHATLLQGATTIEEAERRLGLLKNISEEEKNNLIQVVTNKRTNPGTNKTVNNLEIQEVIEILNQNNRHQNDIQTFVRKLLANNTIESNQVIAIQKLDDIVDAKNLEAATSIENFKNGSPQTSVLYLGQLNYGKAGHWITVHMIPDANAYNGINVIIVDSMGKNCSINNQRIREIADIWSIRDVPSSSWLEHLDKVLDAENVTFVNGLADTDQERANSAFNHLRIGASALIRIIPNFFSEPTKRVKECTQFTMAFNQIKAHWQGQNINNIQFMGNQVALADITNFDNFIDRLKA